MTQPIGRFLLKAMKIDNFEVLEFSIVLSVKVDINGKKK
jgi:hypothetical protein